MDIRKGVRPTLSIVVAFYNVEKYARRCIESLIDQVGDGCELILVDDGSTDGTPGILDDYSSVEHVLTSHKPNGGLSDARNYGVKLASGKFVAFVDGDDVVSPYYADALIAGINMGGDVVVGELSVVRDGQEGVAWHQPTEYNRINRAQAIEKVCRDEIAESACAKAMPVDYYLTVPFPVGMYYEDLATIVARMGLASNVVEIKNPVYGYVMRSGSIVRSKQIKYKQVSDYLLALDRMEDSLREIGAFNEEQFACRRLLVQARILPMLPFVIDDIQRSVETERWIVGTTRNNVKDILTNPYLSAAQKLRYLTMALSPSLYRMIMGIYGKMKKRVG